MFKVEFEPSEIVCENAEAGDNLLDIARRCGENLASDCGGAGMCGRCVIRIARGMENVSEITKKERKIFSQSEIDSGMRLACLTKIYGNITAEILPENRVFNQVVLSEGKSRKLKPNAAVKSFTVTLPNATLENCTDEFTRLCRELEKQKAFSEKPEIDYNALKSLPAAVKKGRNTITAAVWKGKRIIGVFPRANVRIFGIAVDIGTTTLAAFLLDLETGYTVSSASMMNPQVRYGDDVLARVSYSMMNENGLCEMHSALVDGIMSLAKEMCENAEIEPNQIAEAVFAGNTVMQHIALGISPATIGVSPFSAVISESVDVRASDVGLQLMDGANVCFLPSEAGFIGADNVAVLVAEELYEKQEPELVVDIGTNSEIAFGCKDKIYVTSCATGPALEGAHIKCGMRAANGAIEHISIDPTTFEPTFSVIGGGKPVGICGSGIIDAVAQMAISGIILPSGKFADIAGNPRIRLGQDNKPEYVLYFAQNENERDIVVTSKDIRAVQLAKSALCTGAELIIEKSGMAFPKRVVLAGAFGSFIDSKSVVAMGMLPFDNADIITAVGNAAGVGARYALLSVEKRAEAEKLARNVIFVETAADSEFQTRFAKAMKIGVWKNG